MTSTSHQLLGNTLVLLLRGFLFVSLSRPTLIASNAVAVELDVQKRIFPILSPLAVSSLTVELGNTALRDRTIRGNEFSTVGEENSKFGSLHHAAASAFSKGQRGNEDSEATEFMTFLASSSASQKKRKEKKLKRDLKNPVNILPEWTKKKQNKDSQSTVGPLVYNGGPVMVKNVNIYFIYYGSWPANSGQKTLESFITDISSASPDPSAYTSPRRWWTTNLQFYQLINGVKSYVTSKVTLAKVVYDRYSKGTALSDANIWQVVLAQLNSGALPVDNNGVYFVLVSNDVTATSGMCTQYCGWHTANYFTNLYIKYAFIGNSEIKCPGSCGPAGNNLSGFPGADGMVSVLAHELAESVTDPIPPKGWLEAKGGENADLCAYKYGDNVLQIPSSLSTYNMVGPSGLKFMVQSNYDIATSTCRMESSIQVPYPNTPPPQSALSPPLMSPVRLAASPPIKKLFPPPPQGSGSCKYAGYACTTCKEYSTVKCGCTQNFSCINTCAYWGYPGICKYSTTSGTTNYGCVSKDFKFCLSLAR